MQWLLYLPQPPRTQYQVFRQRYPKPPAASQRPAPSKVLLPSADLVSPSSTLNRSPYCSHGLIFQEPKSTLNNQKKPREDCLEVRTRMEKNSYAYSMPNVSSFLSFWNQYFKEYREECPNHKCIIWLSEIGYIHIPTALVKK